MTPDQLADAPCPVVAIGASAGGFEALELFFKELPPKCGIAFVVLVHTDPAKRSYMAELLGRDTSMPVVTITDGMSIESDRVYVAPGGASIAVKDDTFLIEDSHSARGHTIDVFLRSLAQERENEAICIILSGTGSDGTLGLRAIKEYGGTVMVQSPESAKYSDMPASAIATGLADSVLTATELPARLLDFVLYRKSHDGRGHGIENDDGKRQVSTIIRMLRKGMGHDFTGYKQNTVVRRIERRMQLLQFPSYPEYIRHLHENPEELSRLFRDLMISVTHFFRNEDLFHELNEHVVRRLVETHDSQQSIRVWVPGCATGEEAYSIAMLLADQMSDQQKRVPVQIFATDIDEAHLEMARAGFYPSSIEADVPPEYLKRFFVPDASGYRITKQIRSLLIFSNHNLLADPPFSRLDLISCRNVLIYLNQDIQSRLFPLFHYGLRPGGFLFLGPSESIGGHSNLFAEVHRHARIFARKTFVPQPMIDFPLSASDDRSTSIRSRGLQRQNATVEETLAAMAERVLLSEFTPAAVIINDQDDILRFHGHTGLFLEPPAGRPDLNVLEMARPGLRPKLRAAIHRARSRNERVNIERVHYRANDGMQAGRLCVRPITEPGFDDGLLLVVFEPMAEEPEAANLSRRKAPPSDAEHPGIRDLELELRDTRENLQSTIEELETSNEELKSSNEELLSINEEMQSTNEELETSKEELQSVNEELETVNTELTAKLRELTRANSDMKNLLESTQIATIFLDTELRIQRFTPAVIEIFNLIATDVGRPITDLSLHIVNDGLVEDVHAVLRSLMRVEREVRILNDRTFVMRVLPYRTIDNVIDGVVITFVEITVQKKAEAVIEEARRFAEDVVMTLRQPLLILDSTLKIRSANTSYYESFGTTPDETKGRPIFEIGAGQWNDDRLRRLLRRVLIDGTEFEDFEVSRSFPGIGERTMVLHGCEIARDDAGERLMLLAITDVTRERESRERERLMVQELDHRVKNTLASVITLCHLTAESCTSTSAFVKAFEGRIWALSRVHEALAKRSWHGASMTDLIRKTMAPYENSDMQRRIELKGDDIVLPHGAVIPIAMAIHELATNAGKHGACSASTGNVLVEWHAVSEGGKRRLLLDWIETGGPPISRPPESGFGLSLIEKGIGYNLGGLVTMEFPETGLRCRISIPLS